MSLIKVIEVAALKNWLDQAKVLLIDVREPDEVAQGTIPGAVHIPLGKLEFAKIPDYNPNDKKLVLYCRSGKRSEHGCSILLEEEPTLEIYNLQGGILAWLKAS